jgi:hypothetical protein
LHGIEEVKVTVIIGCPVLTNGICCRKECIPCPANQVIGTVMFVEKRDEECKARGAILMLKPIDWVNDFSGFPLMPGEKAGNTLGDVKVVILGYSCAGEWTRLGQLLTYCLDDMLMWKCANIASPGQIGLAVVHDFSSYIPHPTGRTA